MLLCYPLLTSLQAPILKITKGKVAITSSKFSSTNVAEQDLMHFNSATVTFLDSTLMASSGRTLITSDNTDISFTRSQLRENNMLVSVVQLLSSTATITDSEFHYNVQLQEASSMITNHASSLTVFNLTATNNEGYFGGVVSCVDTASLFLYDSHFS